MRWLVGILLLANLVIFLWGYSRTPTPQITKGAAPNIPTLRLLREVAPTGPGEPLVLAEGGGASTQAAVSPAQAPRPADREEAVPPEPMAAEPSATVTVPMHQPASPAGLVAETQVPPEPAVESLAVEPTPASKQIAALSVPEPQPEPQAESPPEPVVLQCGRLGPFTTQVAAEAAQTGLKWLGGDAHLLEKSQQVSVGYWVLVPPLKDRAEGKVKAAELKAAGIDDIWLLAKGSMRNAISLGQFSVEANAKRRAAAVAAAGFTAEVREKTKRVKRFWLEFQAPADVSLPSSLRPLPDDITVEKQSCR